MVNNNLIDIWRTKNPGVKRFTWRQRNPLRQSRLDYWLVSDVLIHKIVKCEIEPSIRSDHSVAAIHLNLEKIDRGKGYWKMNVKHLQDQRYINNIKTLFSDIKEEYKQ